MGAFYRSAGHRLKNIVRAQIGSRRKPALTVIDLLPEEPAKEVWTQEFLDTLERHRLIRTDYYQSSSGPWPQWHCKCGESGYFAVHDSLETAQIRAMAQGHAHVIEMNKAEAEAINTGEDFAF